MTLKGLQATLKWSRRGDYVLNLHITLACSVCAEVCQVLASNQLLYGDLRLPWKTSDILMAGLREITRKLLVVPATVVVCGNCGVHQQFVEGNSLEMNQRLRELTTKEWLEEQLGESRK